MAEAELENRKATSRGHLAYASLLAVSILLCSRQLMALATYAWQNESSSQILLIPAISGYLVWLARKRVFAQTAFSFVPGLALTVGGGILFWLAGWKLPLSENGALCLSALAVVVIWTGGFVLCYGGRASRAAAFPLLLLLLMVPFPTPILDRIIYLLQAGSTEITYSIFKVLGVPVFRQGFLLSVPGVTIEVAKECSSIRSSMALLITCLIAAHLYLRTWWKGLLFVLLSLPLSVIKNGVRIATLTLLSVYVNPDFLRGRLHREGGFVFFFLALLMLWPVFVALEKSDQPAVNLAVPARPEALERG